MAQRHEPDYSKVPDHMESSIRHYINDGRQPGGFLSKLLENDLVGSFSAADSTNREHMDDWVDFLFNEAPANCWGSEEAIRQWVNQDGLLG